MEARPQGAWDVRRNKSCEADISTSANIDGQLAGSSGHSRCRKSRFAGTLSSIFIPVTLASTAKDFYLEKLGAHPIAMGVLFFVVSFFAPCNEIFSGRLQNQEALRRFFPVERWGRKAPWLFTHTIILALACGLLFVPPKNAILLHGWFFVFSIIMFWAISTCLIAFESCRQEIYAYNEERAGVEVLCKFSCIVGIGYACLPLLVLLAQSTMMLRLAASAFFAVGVLAFGLQAKPVWLEARSVNVEEKQASLLQDFRDTWQNVAFRHLVCVRLYDGLYQGIQSTNLLYYLTYILQLKGAERSGWVLLVGLCSMVGEMGVAVVVGRLMNERKNSFRIQDYVVWFRAVDAVATVVLLAFPMLLTGSGPLIGGRSLGLDRSVFLLWTTLNRVLLSPFTFWRVGAQCWVVDEDIHCGDGVRREAAFIGVASAAANFARALAAAVSFLGYALVGLRPQNCELQCASAAAGDCLDVCMLGSIMLQPDALRWYIRLLNIVGLAVCEILLVYHVAAFPIRGIRLARLYNNQTLAYGGAIESGTAMCQIQKLMSSPTMQHIVEAQHGESVVVMDDNVGAGMARALTFRKKGGKVSASVVFGSTVQSIRAEGTTPARAVLSAARGIGLMDLMPLETPQLCSGAVGEEHLTLTPPPAFPGDMLRCCPYMGPWTGGLHRGRDGRLIFMGDGVKA